jgi:hypothetical protein
MAFQSKSQREKIILLTPKGHGQRLGEDQISKQKKNMFKMSGACAIQHSATGSN